MEDKLARSKARLLSVANCNRFGCRVLCLPPIIGDGQAVRLHALNVVIVGSSPTLLAKIRF